MTYTRLAMVVSIAVCVAVVLNGLARLRDKGRRGPAEPAPSSLSFLAGLSFFAGLGALLMVAVSGILSMSLGLTGVINVWETQREAFELASRILLYAGLLPAVGSVALALAARGAIAEAEGKMRGRPLYRTGVLLSVLSAVIVLDAKILSPSTWAAASDQLFRISTSQKQVDRGYYGAKVVASPDSQGNLVTEIEAGSPAEKSGLRKGDRILAVDGVLLGPKELIPERLATFPAGARIVVDVRRGTEPIMLVADLGSSLAQFEPLLDLLEDQSLDDERFAVLKAAGLDRRYTAEELTKICKLFDFDESRLKVISRSLPHLQDPQNAFRVLATLDFSDSKEKASGWIENAKPK